jgi:hypothetical protein
MTDSESAIEHFRRLETLAAKLTERGIAVYEHEYTMLAFGSFRLELGTRHRRWGFSWDGKEGFISFSDPYTPRGGRTAPPVSGHTKRLGFGPEIPYSFIEGFNFGE